MLGLKPFFKYFGGKWRIAPRYPAPEHDILIEPFAGAAGYSLRYPDRKVVLVEPYDVLVGIWCYLIDVQPSEILALPDVPDDGTVDDLNVCQEAKWLIGFWVNAGTERPCQSPSKWMREGKAPGTFWGRQARQRIASQVEHIRHWCVIHGDYSSLPDHVEATWFVDPPYQVRGTRYVHSNLDYATLGAWCRSRQGQVMVCENEGADWLPFQPFCDARATPGYKRPSKVSREVLWTNTPCLIKSRPFRIPRSQPGGGPAPRAPNQDPTPRPHPPARMADHYEAPP